MRKLPKSRSALSSRSITQDGFTLPGTPTNTIGDPVVIGRIARPVGTKGQVKVVIESGDLTRLKEESSITLMTTLGFRSFKITSQQVVGSSIRLKLEGVDSIDSAALLSGMEIVVNDNERQTLDKSEYYDDGIIGCRARSEEGTDLGMIMEIMHQGHHDLWIIDGPYGEIMVPAVGSFILDVDIEKHLITVRCVEGLWSED